MDVARREEIGVLEDHLLVGPGVVLADLPRMMVVIDGMLGVCGPRPPRPSCPAEAPRPRLAQGRRGSGPARRRGRPAFLRARMHFDVEEPGVCRWEARSRSSSAGLVLQEDLELASAFGHEQAAVEAETPGPMAFRSPEVALRS